MAKFAIPAGTTSKRIAIFIQDSSSTTGAGLTGLTSASGSLICYTQIDTDGNVGGTVQALQAATKGTWLTRGFVEKDATNMKGLYEFGVPDALLASGVKWAIIMLSGAANMAPCVVEIEVTAVSNQDAVRGGMTALPNANAAAANGLPVLGTNATAISFTAGMTISNAGGDALALTSSGSNGNALNAAGNGTGAGIKATGGATGNGVQAVGGATSGSAVKASGTAGNAIALELAGQGSAAALSATGGATGAGAKFVGGGTSGDGIDVTTTAGDGLAITPTAGNAIVATANGTSKHGAVITGGTAGTSDGLKAVAGTGGVPIRGDITGNITGNLSGSAGSVTGAVGSVTGAVGSVTGAVGSVTGAVGSVTGAVGSVTGNVGGNVVGSVASVTGAVGSVTGNVGGNVVGSTASVTGAVGSVTGNVGGNVVGSVASVTAAVAITSNIKKNQALAKFQFLITDSTTHAPKTGVTVTCTRSIDGGAFGAGTLANVTEISNGTYTVDFGAGDLNGNVIILRATGTASDDTFERIVTQP